MAYGKCSPDGCSLRLGGTLLYFLESFVLVFSSAPVFPRWSFYAARGEHLWSLFGNVMPELKQRNHQDTLPPKILTESVEQTGGNYGLFLTFAVLRSGTRIPEIRMTEIKNSTFFIRNEVFWGSGPPWGQVWNRRSKNVIFRAKV